MAEYCVDCLNKMDGTNDNERKYILSKELELCEGCGEWKHVVIIERRAYYMRKFRYILLPVHIVCGAIYVIWRLLTLPYFWLVEHTSKNKKSDTF